MATEKDVLLDTLAADQYAVRGDRLNYATGELLGADDFQAEQLYHRRQLAMALRLLYGSGTLAGLKVVVVPGDKEPTNPLMLTDVELQVKPGIAIDRAGRLVEVPVAVSLRLKKWFTYITDPAQTGDPHAPDRLAAAYDSSTKKLACDVFLSFHPCQRGWTPAFASGPFDALDASQPSRIRDAYELNLLLRDPGPLPAFDPWASVPGGATAAQVQEAILEAWDNLLPPVNEQGDFHELPAELNDPTAVRLARVSVPVTGAGAPVTVDDLDWRATSWNWQSAPVGDNTQNVDNSARIFIVPPALLRRLHNL